MNIYNMTDGFYKFCSVLQFGSAGFAILSGSYFSYQDHILVIRIILFRKLILEITKVNIYSLVIYTIKRNEMNCKLSVNAQNVFQL